MNFKNIINKKLSALLENNFFGEMAKKIGKWHFWLNMQFLKT